ncbi:MAG: SMP-30/gluconolactonase/LRE family protein, partial [Dehalococcoidia bacterium]|nr:SMP-30/gluconolactonase/LRE family protein [Dehalococcoidia bacterium]
MSTLNVQTPGLRELIDPDAPVERIAGGLGFTEGPVWRDGSLLFSDIPNNRFARWHLLPEGPELTT